MKQKTLYSTPSLAVVELSGADVITTSSVNNNVGADWFDMPTPPDVT